MDKAAAPYLCGRKLQIPGSNPGGPAFQETFYNVVLTVYQCPGGVGRSRSELRRYHAGLSTFWEKACDAGSNPARGTKPQVQDPQPFYASLLKDSRRILTILPIFLYFWFPLWCGGGNQLNAIKLPLLFIFFSPHAIYIKPSRAARKGLL